MSQTLVPYIHGEGEKAQIWEHFYYDPKSKIIYFRRRFNGKRIKFSTGLTTEKAIQAKRFANAEFERRIGKRKTFEKTLIMDEMKAFMKVVEAEDKSRSTMYNYYQAEKDILAFWGEKYPEEITVDEMPNYYDWFRQRGIIMENNLKVFKRFCKYLHQKVVDGRPLLPAIPTIKDPNRKKVERLRAEKKERVLTEAEFKAIYDAGNDEEKMIALIMYTMATRIDETLKLDFSKKIILDDELPHYRWSVGTTKIHSMEGLHALNSSLIKPLNILRAVRKAQGTDLLFPQERDIRKPLKHQQIEWKDWAKRAGLDWHWTAHTFRHTCLTNLFNDTKNNQLMICKLYRVSMKVAMKTYIKVKRESILELRDAVKVNL